MTKGLIFWVIMILWLLFSVGVLAGFVTGHALIGGSLIVFVLFLLLGWQVFGAPIR